MIETVAKTTAEKYGIPALCCTPGNHANHFDINQSWTCQRTHHLYNMNSWAAEVDRERARAGKLRHPRRAAHLLRWVADQEATVARLAASKYWADYPCAGVGIVA